ncbi:MAG TPA: serine/threonine-protein kinase [Acidimicrobiia bacterium]|nr:serine/threonine-protein kinase [Acidimicrobiia bacterium]
MTTDVLHHDRYRVEQTLGTGAMGTVVLAHDIVLDRRVAVKVLADNLAAHGDFRQRFLREARLAARLCHPNIVQVFDAGESGRPFLVMEYVDGKTVAERLACGLGFSDDEVLALAADLSAGLAHAHAMGIVHRDVKPHNVLIGPDGMSKLTDFGIARALEDHGLTEVGTVLGTAQFMAPEQAAGSPVGPAADVFALGAVLRHVAGDSLPTKLEPLVEAALSTEPTARPSAAELNARLSASPSDTAPTVIASPVAPTKIAAPPVATTTVGRSETSWRTPAVVGLAALAVIVLLLALFPRGEGGDGVTPVPAGADAAQSARNLATWLRDQADGTAPTTGAPR